MAIHTLVTGANGAGKTLMGVSRILGPLVGTFLVGEEEDQTTREPVKISRRLVVGGVRDLVVEHVMMDVPRWDPEKDPSPFIDLKRDPGDPPLDVPHSMLNWWAWVMPGDVLFVDEAQRLFRPMASGRKVPMFIEKLETIRHYGVEIIYVTQHPNLLHSNVRNLIGKHMHVRRVFGMARCIVYEWDHCSNPDRTKDSVATYFRHDKKAFSLYKSAEIHTKQKAGVPIAVFVGGAALIALPFAAFAAYSHVTAQFKPKPIPGAIAASAASSRSTGKKAASGSAAARDEPTSGRGTADAPAASAPGRFWLGCIAMKHRCECMSYAGTMVPTKDDFCRESAQTYGKAIPYPIEPPPAVAVALAPPAVEKTPSRPVIMTGGDFRDRAQRTIERGSGEHSLVP